MLLVIVGAGASHDSADGGEGALWQPPLTRDLFAAKYVSLLRRYPQAAPLANQVRLAVKKDRPFEQVLEEIRDEGGTYPARRQQLLALKFYLRSVLFMCSGEWSHQYADATNYAQLAAVIEKCRREANHRVAYVTFNYDTLLESGLAAARVKTLGDLASFVEGPVQVFKVHGSVNWAQVATLPNFREMPVAGPPALCDLVDDLTITDEFVVDLGGELSGGRVPAIAIPTQSKSEFACPHEHIVELERVLPQVRGVVTIGWRGAEEHFGQLLGANLPPKTPAFVVTESQERCDETTANLTRGGLATVESFHDGGFTGLMSDDAAGSRRLRRFVESVFASSTA
jgi:hypothetical protein